MSASQDVSGSSQPVCRPTGTIEGRLCKPEASVYAHVSPVFQPSENPAATTTTHPNIEVAVRGGSNA